MEAAWSAILETKERANFQPHAAAPVASEPPHQNVDDCDVISWWLFDLLSSHSCSASSEKPDFFAVSSK